MQPNPGPPRRPFLITLLAEFFLVFAAAGGLRAYAAVQDWALLVELKAGPDPLYFLLVGIFWGAVGLTAGLGLLVGWYHADRLARLAALLLFAAFWADRLLALRMGGPQPNTVFAAVVSLAALAFALFTLTRTSARRYFSRAGRPGWSYGKRSGN